MIDDLDFLTRGMVRDGRLTKDGQERAEFIARAMKYQTAYALSLLYTEVARLAALAGKGGDQ